MKIYIKIKTIGGRVFNIKCEEDGFILIEDTIFYICYHNEFKTNINKIMSDKMVKNLCL